jgi:SAM-dependent methyltransferase
MMQPVVKYGAIGAGLLGLWELAWWARRRGLRQSKFAEAQGMALALHRPLVVVGAPDGGVTAGYGCGDVTVDIAATSTCPRYIKADITKTMPFADDSVVVFVSCVLEYVDDAEAAAKELRRISGGHVVLVRVEPWTLTSILYPGRQRTLDEATLKRLQLT